MRIPIQSKTAKTIFALAIAAFALALGTNSASAHAFGQRYDLPIPLSYFLIGAVAAVALSFVVMGMFVRTRGEAAAAYPRYDLLRMPLVGAALGGRVLYNAVGALSAAVLALLLVAGFVGTDRAVENLSPTFIWIIWWVGMGYAAALVGNLWAYLNPWKVVYEWLQKIGGGAARDENPPFQYPEWLDVLPAVALFFVFAWAENVFTGAFRPFTLSIMVLAYSLITWAGMALFGKNIWLRHGEAFTVLFGLFSRFSLTEARTTNRAICRDCASGCADESDCVDCYACFERAGADGRELNLRPFAVGLASQKRISTGDGGVRHPGAGDGDVRRLSGYRSLDGFSDVAGGSPPAWTWWIRSAWRRLRWRSRLCTRRFVSRSSSPPASAAARGRWRARSYSR